jgi:hypothetical protein
MSTETSFSDDFPDISQNKDIPEAMRKSFEQLISVQQGSHSILTKLPFKNPQNPIFLKRNLGKEKNRSKFEEV